MFSKKQLCYFLLVLFFSPQTMANNLIIPNQKISLDMYQVAVGDVLRAIADFSHLNVVLSPNIHGLITLHMKNVACADALKLLLTTQGLSTLSISNLIYIAPATELLKRSQQQSKLNLMQQSIEPLIPYVRQIQYAKASDIAHLLQGTDHSVLAPHESVKVDERTNKLYFLSTKEKLPAIIDLINQFDIPVQQVLIEAHLASIDQDIERKLGINFILADKRSRDISQYAGTAPGLSLAVMKLPDGFLLDAVLSAIEQNGQGELLSNPRLFTANQQTASIEAGEEIPYQETSRSGATSVAFKKAVLSLRVTPQIMPEGKVLLQLQVNQDKPSNRLVLGVPAINTRQVNTNVLVKNGQTIVLGGIYEINQEFGEQRIPFLGKIPLVGWLFKQQNVVTSKRELLIFVTPKIVSVN